MKNGCSLDAVRRSKPELFLYDVTSSYLEGEDNAFGAYGYNRDGKKGKKQIVIGLLCDEKGVPRHDGSVSRQHARSADVWRAGARRQASVLVVNGWHWWATAG